MTPREFAEVIKQPQAARMLSNADVASAKTSVAPNVTTPAVEAVESTAAAATDLAVVTGGDCTAIMATTMLKTHFQPFKRMMMTC